MHGPSALLGRTLTSHTAAPLWKAAGEGSDKRVLTDSCCNLCLAHPLRQKSRSCSEPPERESSTAPSGSAVRTSLISYGIPSRQTCVWAAQASGGQSKPVNSSASINEDGKQRTKDLLRSCLRRPAHSGKVARCGTPVSVTMCFVAARFCCSLRLAIAPNRTCNRLKRQAQRCTA